MDDQQDIQLQQIANIVIDAYMNRDKRFVPDFGSYGGIIFLERPKDHRDHPDLQVGHWYQKSDYEPEGQS